MSKTEKDSFAMRETSVIESSPEYFYSESLKRYIQRAPLFIDHEIVKKAEELKIDLSWDEEGHINHLDYPTSRKLFDSLGLKLMSPPEFWKVYDDVQKVGDEEMLESLKADGFAEWLDAVYRKDNNGHVYMIEHPEINDEDGEISFSGEEKRVIIPEGRPGWFIPEDNINPETGFPINVDDKRTQGTPEWSRITWKFWSVFKINEFVVPIRGTILSSSTPSLDTDMPWNVHTKVLLIRPTYDKLPTSEIDTAILEKADTFYSQYLTTCAQQPADQKESEHDQFYQSREVLFSFVEQYGKMFAGTKDKKGLTVKEKLIDMLGSVRIIARSKNDNDTVQRLDSIAREIFEIKRKKVLYSNFSEFITSAKDRLQKALDEKKRIVFVMGHKNPDTDTAVSSMLEAYRNSLIDMDTAYIPVIQDRRIPDEIKKLLGNTLSDGLLKNTDQLYQQAVNSGLLRFILVDHNVDIVQRFASSIIDHHILSKDAKKMDKPVTWEMAGSCTAQVIQKMEGLGLTPDQNLSRIMYGATLMDTENRSNRKMTYKDRLIMDNLKHISGIENDGEFFQSLMSELLNTDYAELLFARDYKEDWGTFGFAVAKVKGMFDKETGQIQKTQLLEELKRLARENNRNNNFPVTMVKVVDYLENNITVNREKVLLIFNDNLLPEFKKTMFELVEGIIKHEYQGKAAIEMSDDAVDFWGVGDQLSRKVTAPYIEPIINAYNQYFWSEETGKYIKRSFLKTDPQVLEVAAKLGIKIYKDKEDNVVGITYYEAKKLIEALGYSMMSLPEYWKARNDAISAKDKQMIAHLQTLELVEMLDTCIIGPDKFIHHPKIIYTDEEHIFDGEVEEYHIPVALPGLIHPDDIDPSSGFPSKIHPPSEFMDEALLRYWSSDRFPALTVRSVIALYGQNALDTKIHPDDALMKLSFRPCVKIMIPPEVRITMENEAINVVIKSEGKIEEYKIE